MWTLLFRALCGRSCTTFPGITSARAAARDNLCLQAFSPETSASSQHWFSARTPMLQWSEVYWWESPILSYMFLYFQAVWCVHGLSDWPRNQTHPGLWARWSGPDDLFGEGSRSRSTAGNYQGKHHHYIRLIRSGGYLLICEISWVQFRLRGEGHVVSARGQRVVLCSSRAARAFQRAARVADGPWWKAPSLPCFHSQMEMQERVWLHFQLSPAC